jgi:hypothetical protein
MLNESKRLMSLEIKNKINFIRQKKFSISRIMQLFLSIQIKSEIKKCFKLSYKYVEPELKEDLPLYLVKSYGQGRFFVTTNAEYAKEIKEIFHTDIFDLKLSNIDIIEFAQFEFLDKKNKQTYTIWNGHESCLSNVKKRLYRVDKIINPWISDVNCICDQNQLFKNSWYHNFVLKREKRFSCWSPVWLAKLKEKDETQKLESL